MKADDKQEIEKEIINEEEIAQRTKVTYWVHPHHRDNRPDKSQWTIIPDEEFECFVKAIITDKATWFCFSFCRCHFFVAF